ncbi:MAG: hypothetical protein LBB18_01465 [Puniceicoccales bacterium]|jgi:hypothetical protein|nr:hypothetical protein [Puniceicoccales bacterium]
MSEGVQTVESRNITGANLTQIAEVPGISHGDPRRLVEKSSKEIPGRDIKLAGSEGAKLMPPPGKFDVGDGEKFSKSVVRKSTVKTRYGAKLWAGIPEEAEIILREKKFSVLTLNEILDLMVKFVVDLGSTASTENSAEIDGLKWLYGKILVIGPNEPQISNETYLREILESVNDENRDLLLPIIKGIRCNEGGYMDPRLLRIILNTVSFDTKNRESIGRIFANSAPGEFNVRVSQSGSLQTGSFKNSMPEYIRNLFDTNDVFRIENGGVTLNLDVKFFFELFFPSTCLLTPLSYVSIESSRSTDRRVLKIEKRMRELGTTVTFADSLELAVATEKAFSKVKKVTNEVPPYVFLFSDVTRLPWLVRAVAMPLGKNFDKMAPIFVCKFQDLSKCQLGDDVCEPFRNLVKFSNENVIDASIEGLILHELGHSYHFRTPGFSGEDETKARAIFSRYVQVPADQTESEREMNDRIRNEVSGYALRGGNGYEFVAETFCGLMLGKSFSEEIMALYKDLSGPMFDFGKLKSTSKNRKSGIKGKKAKQ